MIYDFKFQIELSIVNSQFSIINYQLSIEMTHPLPPLKRGMDTVAYRNSQIINHKFEIINLTDFPIRDCMSFAIEVDGHLHDGQAAKGEALGIVL